MYKCNEIKFHYVSQNDLYFHNKQRPQILYLSIIDTFKYIVYNLIQSILNVSSYKLTIKTGCIYNTKEFKLQQKSFYKK